MFDFIMSALEIFGIAICAITGATKGIKKKLDIFGVTVFACVVGTGGGIIRDVMIGATPVAALTNESYLITGIIAGVIFFFIAPRIAIKLNLILVGDAIALGVFTVTGAAKAANCGLSFIGIILSGVVTAIGGGIIRDLMAGEIPTVLKSDFYATAALIGGIVYYILFIYDIDFIVSFFIVASVVIGLRIWGIRFKIQFPSTHLKNEKDIAI